MAKSRRNSRSERQEFRKRHFPWNISHGPSVALCSTQKTQEIKLPPANANAHPEDGDGTIGVGRSVVSVRVHGYQAPSSLLIAAFNLAEISCGPSHDGTPC
jgi:hypothetical protein